MSNFAWSREEIEKNQISNALKEELIKEIDNVDERTTFSFKNSRTSSFKEFKKRYKLDKEEQERNLGKINDTSLYFVGEVERDFYQTYDIVCPKIIPEDLIQKSIKFYAFLNDSLLAKEYASYLLRERKHINIDYAEGKNLAKIYKGCTKKDQNRDIYITYYIENKLTDFVYFLHETAHMLSYRLFQDKMNPLIKKHFREVEAYFIEFMACYFLGIETEEEAVKDTLTFNVLEEAYDKAKNLVIQDLAAKHIFMPSDARIKKELQSLQISDNISPLKQYLSSFYGQLIGRYNSIMIAYDLYSSCNDDIEKALYEYKRFLTTNITDIEKLFKEFNITYPYDECKNALGAIKKFKI